jgi:RHS repeat-associated protein
MKQSIHDLLAKYRAAAQTEREKGTYFRYEASYADLYSDVWLCADWAREIGTPQFGISAKDTGIDLVAKTHGTAEYHAIQCKCYAPDYSVRKSDIDSFFTASGKKPFTQRIIVTTTNDWSDNAENALSNLQPPVYKIDLHDLENTQIDWSKYQPSVAPALTRLFSDVGLLLAENYATGPLAGLSVSNRYDQYLRRTNLSILNPQSAILYSQSYGFDTDGRLSTVTQGGYSGSYGYLTNSPLVGTLTFKTNTTTRLTTTRAFDALNRLQSITSVPSGSGAPPLPVSSAYDYNTANQRTRMTLADGSYWIYTYDRLGQVVSGKRYWQDGTPVAGQQFEYGFDDIGNRKTAATGGDATGAGLRAASYGANLLNQYTNRTVPGTVDILGVANPTAAVTVNGNTAYRKGDYFWQALSVGNSNAAQYPLVTTISQYGAKATNTGNVYLPQTPEAFTHDADGNLTQDGRWDYTWDGENRLIAMQTRSAVLASGVPEQRLEFAYDPQSRRISKTVSNLASGNWNLASAHRFLYDGWNLLAILNPQSSIVQSFAWGLDLSGSLQGAGGVGGLLWVSDASTISGQPSTHAACYDGNGNVVALISFTDASLSARYEYGPFGEPIRQTGAMAEANPFCFSTKFTDNESGHLYYGYRYYVPYVGRWLSRDPIGENGGENLCAVWLSDYVNRFDLFGLCPGVSCNGSASYGLGPGAPGGGKGNPAGDAKTLCQQMMDQAKKDGGPKELPDDGSCTSCPKELSDAEDNPVYYVKDLLNQFGKDCPRPLIRCARCSGAGGWYDVKQE